MLSRNVGSTSIPHGNSALLRQPGRTVQPPTPYTTLATKRILSENTPLEHVQSSDSEPTQEFGDHSPEEDATNGGAQDEMSMSQSDDPVDDLQLWLADQAEPIFRELCKEFLRDFGPNLLAVQIKSELKAKPPLTRQNAIVGTRLKK